VIIELCLNLELLERLPLENEEKENLIRELISIIERNETIVGKEDDLKLMN